MNQAAENEAMHTGDYITYRTPRDKQISEIDKQLKNLNSSKRMISKQIDHLEKRRELLKGS